MTPGSREEFYEAARAQLAKKMGAEGAARWMETLIEMYDVPGAEWPSIRDRINVAVEKVTGLPVIWQGPARPAPTGEPVQQAAALTVEAQAPITGPTAPVANQPDARAPSQSEVAARARRALGAKGAKRAQAARRAQVRAQARAKLKADQQDHYTDGGFGKMPNLAVDLIAPMPAPVVKAYVVACRLADPHDGTFEISHRILAEWIGSRHRTHAERAMRRLVDAGLVTQRWRGGPGRPNGYRLASLAKLDLQTVKTILAQPLTVSGANKHRRRVHEGREHARATSAS